MERIDNMVRIVWGFVGGIASQLIGGRDLLLMSLIALMAFDYITGVLKAFFLKQLNSKTGFWGIVKKCVILIIVSASYLLNNILSNELPLREIVITFFISNESLSLLENAAVFVPIPQKLKDCLSRLNDENK